jgi:shikimate dehydrogenase
VALAEDLGVDVDTMPVAGDLLVNCTSVGLEPTADGQALEALGLGALEPPAVVVDLVYGDGPTPVERWAAAGGARFVGGKEILVQQGALSLALWTGRPAPVDVMRAALG